MAASEPAGGDQLGTACVIAGGGPAGMMLGFLLARACIDVVVLEKHADFFRDFRGDTIHPSTLELMHELGLLDRFLALPHYKVDRLGGSFGETHFTASFAHLPVRCPYVAFMPQWDFLNFIAEEAKRYPTFRLLMGHEATGVIERDGRVEGLRVAGPGGTYGVVAGLTIAADGRGSTVRASAGLALDNYGAPMDVLWFRLAHGPADPHQLLGRFDDGRGVVLIDRGDYWQCGLIIAKGSFEALRTDGIEAFRRVVAKMTGFALERMAEIADWDQVKLLSVQVNRLPRWHRPGLLCIGDAAHAMSPIGGVGINLAIQDAVAAANLLFRPFWHGKVDEAALARVQARRDWPTRMTQRVQIGIQNYLAAHVFGRRGPPKAPWPLRLIARFPVLGRLPARIVGMGFRPEHIEVPERPWR